MIAKEGYCFKTRIILVVFHDDNSVAVFEMKEEDLSRTYSSPQRCKKPLL
ncbi:MAG: hypothetical protein HYW88_01265 [Candidatus Sungbacteria bacterium]|nr:hypothetical protein [Candidatus Sungbacteria bacterium]